MVIFWFFLGWGIFCYAHAEEARHRESEYYGEEKRRGLDARFNAGAFNLQAESV